MQRIKLFRSCNITLCQHYRQLGVCRDRKREFPDGFPWNITQQC